METQTVLPQKGANAECKVAIYATQYISTTDSIWLIQSIENIYSHNHDNIRSRHVKNISWDRLYLEIRLFVVRWPISTQTTICWLGFKGQIKSMRIKWYNVMLTRRN